MNNPYITEKVRARLDELQKIVDEGLVMSPSQVKAALTEIAADEKTPQKVKLSALDKLAKTHGMYKETVVNEHSGGVTIEDKRAAMNEWIERLNGGNAEAESTT